MSGEALFERYREALKRGHLASLRGDVQDALAAYSAAAAIAPERPAPHASAGNALLRARRPAEALRHYAHALDLARGDEDAMLGRAHALAMLGRRGEAAAAFDTVADARAEQGRLADAVDAGRRALELAEGRGRRRNLERLIEQLRSAEPGEPGRLALEHALRILDGVAVAHSGQPAPARAEGAADGPGAAGPADLPIEILAAELAAQRRSALDRELPAGMDAEAAARAADMAVDAGDTPIALARLLDLAAIHWHLGNTAAALDACCSALSIAPGDVDVHLALAELYRVRGWPELAAEKLDLLDRFAALAEDTASVARIAAARAEAV
jgi:tetratricopeptide (TPR) repeat protein